MKRILSPIIATATIILAAGCAPESPEVDSDDEDSDVETSAVLSCDADGFTGAGQGATRKKAKKRAKQAARDACQPTCGGVCEADAVECTSDGSGFHCDACASCDEDGGGEPGACSALPDGGMDGTEAEFIALLNAYRASRGLAQLTSCNALGRAGQAHSEDMRDNEYFSHTGQDGSQPRDRACRACYGACSTAGIGETLAGGRSDALGALDQLKGSPPHNAILLEPSLRAVGVGRALGGLHDAYWSVVYGTDASGCP